MSIIIITAMQEEYDAIQSVLEWDEESGDHSFNGQRVIICKSGIGKVNAAQHLADAVIKEKMISTVDLVINTGVAGNLSRDQNIGDIVLGTECFHHDVDATGFGYEKFQVPGMPASYKANPGLVRRTLELSEGMNVRVYAGPIATGDQFIHSHIGKERINLNKPDARCVEMESAAFAQVCYNFKIKFLAIRSISDDADGKAPTNFNEFLKEASLNAAELVKRLVIDITSPQLKKEGA